MRLGLKPCPCGLHGGHSSRRPKLVAVTGGPGAGKTALLELARQQVLCSHCIVLSEAATIAFGGGFPRLDDIAARKASQRVIFHIQRELEALALNREQVALVLCDRGTPDNLAYWPENDNQAWSAELGTDLSSEIHRYDAVIHLQPPSESHGYVNSEIRRESATVASQIDCSIQRNWEGHPNYYRIASKGDFITKAQEGLKVIAQFLPDCCKDCMIQRL